MGCNLHSRIPRIGRVLFRKARSIGGGALAVVYFIVNGPGLYSAEANFWRERRAQANRRVGNGDTLLANLPGGQRPGAVDALLPSLNPRLSNGVLESPAPIPSLFPLPLSAQKTFNWLPAAVAPYGDLREVHVAPKADAPVVVLLQDAHEIAEVQNNLAGMTTNLSAAGHLSLVGMEGAVGAFALEPYRRTLNSDVTRGLADLFVQLGYFSGPEAAAVVNDRPLQLWGVEDPRLYTENVQAFEASETSRSSMKSLLLNLRKEADTARNRHYGPALLAFDQQREAFGAHRLGLGEYAASLLKVQPEARKGFDNVRRLQEAVTSEARLDFKVVEKERLNLIEVMSRRLSEDNLNGLVRISLDYRAGRMTYGDYHRSLRDLCAENGIDLERYTQLNAYIAYMLLAERIDRDGLLNEMDQLERTVEDRLAKTPEEKALVSVRRQLGLLDKLTDHRMTPAEWRAYGVEKARVNEIPSTLASLLGTSAEAGAEAFPSARLKPFEDFCQRATDRNGALVHNLVGKMRAEKASSALLVAGGFHTAGLTAVLRQQGLSFAVVAPRLSQSPPEARPLDVFARKPIPLETLLAGDIIHLAYPRLTAKASIDIGDVRARQQTAQTLFAGLRELLTDLSAPLSPEARARLGEWSREFDFIDALGTEILPIEGGGKALAVRVKLSDGQEKEYALVFSLEGGGAFPNISAPFEFEQRVTLSNRSVDFRVYPLSAVANGFPPIDWLSKKVTGARKMAKILTARLGQLTRDITGETSHPMPKASGRTPARTVAGIFLLMMGHLLLGPMYRGGGNAIISDFFDRWIGYAIAASGIWLLASFQNPLHNAKRTIEKILTFPFIGHLPPGVNVSGIPLSRPEAIRDLLEELQAWMAEKLREMPPTGTQTDTGLRDRMDLLWKEMPSLNEIQNLGVFDAVQSHKEHGGRLLGFGLSDMGEEAGGGRLGLADEFLNPASPLFPHRLEALFHEAYHVLLGLGGTAQTHRDALRIQAVLFWGVSPALAARLSMDELENHPANALGRALRVRRLALEFEAGNVEPLAELIREKMSKGLLTPFFSEANQASSGAPENHIALMTKAMSILTSSEEEVLLSGISQALETDPRMRDWPLVAALISNDRRIPNGVTTDPAWAEGVRAAPDHPASVEALVRLRPGVNPDQIEVRAHLGRLSDDSDWGGNWADIETVDLRRAQGSVETGPAGVVSVRFSGVLNLPPGRYEFYLTARHREQIAPPVFQEGIQPGRNNRLTVTMDQMMPEERQKRLENFKTLTGLLAARFREMAKQSETPEQANRWLRKAKDATNMPEANSRFFAMQSLMLAFFEASGQGWFRDLEPDSHESNNFFLESRRQTELLLETLEKPMADEELNPTHFFETAFTALSRFRPTTDLLSSASSRGPPAGTIGPRVTLKLIRRSSDGGMEFLARGGKHSTEGTISTLPTAIDVDTAVRRVAIAHPSLSLFTQLLDRWPALRRLKVHQFEQSPFQIRGLSHARTRVLALHKDLLNASPTIRDLAIFHEFLEYLSEIGVLRYEVLGSRLKIVVKPAGIILPFEKRVEIPLSGKAQDLALRGHERVHYFHRALTAAVLPELDRLLTRVIQGIGLETQESPNSRSALNLPPALSNMPPDVEEALTAMARGVWPRSLEAVMTAKGEDPRPVARVLRTIAESGRTGTVDFVIRSLKDAYAVYERVQNPKPYRIDGPPPPAPFKGSFSEFISTVNREGLVRGTASERVRADIDHNKGIHADRPNFSLMHEGLNDDFAARRVEEIDAAAATGGLEHMLNPYGRVLLTHGGVPILLRFEVEKLPMLMMTNPLEVRFHYSSDSYVSLNALTLDSKVDVLQTLGIETLTGTHREWMDPDWDRALVKARGEASSRSPRGQNPNDRGVSLPSLLLGLSLAIPTALLGFALGGVIASLVAGLGTGVAVALAVENVMALPGIRHPDSRAALGLLREALRDADISSPESAGADYRKAFAEFKRTLKTHAEGINHAKEYRSIQWAFSDGLDAVVREVFRRAAERHPVLHQMALVAYGSYGARRAGFLSDVDLILILPDNMPFPDDKNESGAAVKALRHDLSVALADQDTMTPVKDYRYVHEIVKAMWFWKPKASKSKDHYTGLDALRIYGLTARPVAGDRALHDGGVRPHYRRVLATSRTQVLRELILEREELFEEGSSSFLRLDYKTGLGGIREYDAIVWLSRFLFPRGSEGLVGLLGGWAHIVAMRRVPWMSLVRARRAFLRQARLRDREVEFKQLSREERIQYVRDAGLLFDTLITLLQSFWSTVRLNSDPEYLPMFLASAGWRPDVRDKDMPLADERGGLVHVAVHRPNVPGMVEVTIEASTDRTGVLAILSGLLAAHGLSIRAAEASYKDGRVIDRFFVHLGSLAQETESVQNVKIEKLAHQIWAEAERLLTGNRADLSGVNRVFQSLGRQYRFNLPSGRPIAPSLAFFSGLPGRRNLTILTTDRVLEGDGNSDVFIGTLHIMTRWLAERGYDIVGDPSIRTQRGLALNTFRLARADGQELLRDEEQWVESQLEKFLDRPAITEHDFRFNGNPYAVGMALSNSKIVGPGKTLRAVAWWVLPAIWLAGVFLGVGEGATWAVGLLALPLTKNGASPALERLRTIVGQNSDIFTPAGQRSHNGHSGGLNGLEALDERSIPLVKPLEEAQNEKALAETLRALAHGERVSMGVLSDLASEMPLPGVLSLLGFMGLTPNILAAIDGGKIISDAGEEAVKRALAGQVEGVGDLSVVQRNLIQMRQQLETLVSENPEAGVTVKQVMDGAKIVFVVAPAHRAAIARQIQGIRHGGFKPENIFLLEQPESEGITESGTMTTERWSLGHGAAMADFVRGGNAFALNKPGAAIQSSLLKRLMGQGARQMVVIPLNDLGTFSDVVFADRWAVAQKDLEKYPVVVEVVAPGRRPGGNVFLKNGKLIFRDPNAQGRNEQDAPWWSHDPISRGLGFYRLDSLADPDLDSLPAYVKGRALLDGKKAVSLKFNMGDLFSGVRALRWPGTSHNSVYEEKKLKDALGGAMKAQDRELTYWNWEPIPVRDPKSGREVINWMRPGNGPPIVLVHGALYGPLWGESLLQASPEHAMVVVQFPRTTDGKPEDFVPGQADYIEAVLAALSKHKDVHGRPLLKMGWIAVGHSLGLLTLEEEIGRPSSKGDLFHNPRILIGLYPAPGEHKESAEGLEYVSSYNDGGIGELSFLNQAEVPNPRFGTINKFLAEMRGAAGYPFKTYIDRLRAIWEKNLLVVLGIDPADVVASGSLSDFLPGGALGKVTQIIEYKEGLELGKALQSKGGITVLSLSLKGGHKAPQDKTGAKEVAALIEKLVAHVDAQDKPAPVTSQDNRRSMKRNQAGISVQAILSGLAVGAMVFGALMLEGGRFLFLAPLAAVLSAYFVGEGLESWKNHRAGIWKYHPLSGLVAGGIAFLASLFAFWGAPDLLDRFGPPPLDAPKVEEVVRPITSSHWAEYARFAEARTKSNLAWILESTRAEARVVLLRGIENEIPKAWQGGTDAGLSMTVQVLTRAIGVLQAFPENEGLVSVLRDVRAEVQNDPVTVTQDQVQTEFYRLAAGIPLHIELYNQFLSERGYNVAPEPPSQSNHFRTNVLTTFALLAVAMGTLGGFIPFDALASLGGAEPGALLTAVFAGGLAGRSASANAAEVERLYREGQEGVVRAAKRLVRKAGVSTGNAVNTFLNYARERSFPRNASGGRWPLLEPLYQSAGGVLGIVALPVLLESFWPLVVPTFAGLSGGIPLWGLGAYQLFWHLAHIPGATGSWKDRLRFAFSGEKLLVTVGVLQAALVAQAMGFVDPSGLSLGLAAAILAIPHLVVNAGVWFLARQSLETEISRGVEVRMTAQRILHTSFLGGEPGRHLDLTQYFLRINSVRQWTAAERAQAKTHRERLARVMGLDRRASLETLAFRMARIHSLGTTVLGGRDEPVRRQGLEISLLVSLAEGWVSQRAIVDAYHRGQGMIDVQGPLAEALENDHHSVFELTREELLGNLNERGLALVEALTQVARRSGENRKITWVLPKGSTRSLLNVFLSENPGLSSLIGKGNIIEKSDLQQDLSQLYSVESLLLKAHAKPRVEDLAAPTDLFLVDRSEWDLPDHLTGLARILILISVNIMIDATHRLAEDLKRLTLITLQA